MPHIDGYNTDQGGTRSITLPAASPGDYLRWMAYWRDVESWMLENRRVERVASLEAVPFLEGEIAETLSKAVIEVVSQAKAASDEGRSTVAPTITIPDSDDFPRGAADLMAKRAEWLRSHDGLGIPSIPDELVALREGVMRALLSKV